MNRFLLALSCMPLLASLVIAVFFLMNAQWVNALLSVMCGVIVTCALLYAGITGFVSEGYQAATGIAMVLGIGAILSYSNLFNPDLQRSYSAVAMSFAGLDTYCPANTPDLRRAKEYGLAACLLQSDRDAISATTELQKGVNFGPALTLVDSAVTLAGEEEANHCARAFKAAVRRCPPAFSSVGVKERAALLAAAK